MYFLVLYNLMFCFLKDYRKLTTVIISISFMIYIFGLRPFIVPFIAINLIYFVTNFFKSKILVWLTTILIMIGFDSSLYNEFLVRNKII
jgi:hypothetical protein